MKSTVQLIGLLIIKNNHLVFEEWMERYCGLFNYMYILDHSDNNKSSMIVEKYMDIFYFKKSNEDIKNTNLHKILFYEINKNKEISVENNPWIMLCYLNDFYIHSPEKLAIEASKNNCNIVNWHSLDIIPHSKEKKMYKETKSPFQFRHCWHNGNSSKKCSLLFKYTPELSYSNTINSDGLPENIIKKEYTVFNPCYLHFPVCNFLSEKYEDLFTTNHEQYKECTEYYGNHTLPEFTQNKVFELDIDIYPKIPLTIITPSIRPENLPKILKSMNFDYVTKWVIVYDMEDNAIEKQFEEHPNVDEFFYKGQMPSNSQRNFGVQLVQDGYVYFLDDDNLMHSDFWDFYKTITVKNKIFTFDQYRVHCQLPWRKSLPYPENVTLPGDTLESGYFDTAMYLSYYTFSKQTLWKEDKSIYDGWHYCWDGIMIEELYKKFNKHFIYINKILCDYNSLR